ncbi:MAG: hypothetical protein GY853_13610 [PVC group bacterium]|nr:hypothetical protein [PVC group bacterium]
MATKLNNFHEDLKFSENASEENFWQAIYTKAFPDMLYNIQCKGNNQGQRLGIDRLIYLKSGKTLYIDEKKRRGTYNDILLEYLSNDTTGAPGWMEKDLLIDYLAYAFMPTQVCYLFPWQLLRRVWLKFKNEWKINFKIPPAKNKGYNTHNVAIPTKLLRDKVYSAAVIQL